jgi:hypothetical protein
MTSIRSRPGIIGGFPKIKKDRRSIYLGYDQEDMKRLRLTATKLCMFSATLLFDRPLCNRCSEEVHPGRGDYYLVRIDAVADPGPPVFTEEDLDLDVGAEIERLIRRMKGLSEEELERQVYRRKAIYLCVPCFNRRIVNPVGL